MVWLLFASFLVPGCTLDARINNATSNWKINYGILDESDAVYLSGIWIGEQQ